MFDNHKRFVRWIHVAEHVNRFNFKTYQNIVVQLTFEVCSIMIVNIRASFATVGDAVSDFLYIDLCGLPSEAVLI